MIFAHGRSALQLLSLAAAALWRHGPVGFARRLLAVRTWLPTVLGETVGAIDSFDAIVSRSNGQISGWALSARGAIDRLEILIDGQREGNARLGLPRPGLQSDAPEASICGFQFNLHPERIAADRAVIEVGFVAYPMHGKPRRFAGRTMRLGAARNAEGPLPAQSALQTRVNAPMAEGGKGGGAAAIPHATLRAAPRRAGSSGKIKLTCFTHDLGYGGGQLYLQELLRRLAALGMIECVIRCPSDGPLRHELSRLGYSIELVSEPSITNAAEHDRVTEAVSSWLSDNGFDCVLANTLAGHYAVNAAAQAGLPSIWAVHESFPLPTWCAFYTQELPGSEFFLSRVEAALKRCPAVIFEADATRRMFLRHGSEDGGEERFLRIAYGIDTAAVDAFLRGFDRQRERARLGIADGAQVVLCLGTFEPRKQQALLAQAFAEVAHPDASLWLVGEAPSPYATALRRYLERKGLAQRVRLFPIVPDPYPWYAMADGFALLSDIESMPRTLIEAMAFGLPALATAVFGVPELIDDGETGLLIEPNSLRSAVQGLRRLLDLSDAQRHAMAQAAREKIRRDHDSRGYADACLALMRRLTRERGQG
jgi:D-inositol-3-phosphate glycosyltransferase